MRRPPSNLIQLTGAILLIVAFSSAPLFADKASVVVVGGATLSAAEVTSELSRFPDYQIKALGKGGDPRRQLVEKSLVPRLLYAEEARHQRLENGPLVKAARRQVLVELLHEQLQTELMKSRPVTHAEVLTYQEKHLADFRTPERIHIWRILAKDEEVARKALALARQDGGVQKWRAYSREHSVDRATRMRGGDIGFVHPDGNTDVPRVRVPKELYEQASRVKDGQPLAEPVPEGKYFAAVWRRGSLRPEQVDDEEASRLVTALILEERLATAMDDLLESLRAKHLKSVAPNLLDEVRLPEPNDFPFSPSARAERSAKVRASVKETDHGLR